jgi:multidrug transporter EmrE-like cation transporter
MAETTLDLLRGERALAFLTLLVAITLSASGEMFLKAGMNEVGELHPSLPILVRTFTTPEILVGFALFGAGAVFWLRVLSVVDLSWAYPMLALGYLPVLFASRELLGEEVSLQRWIGAVVVIVGVTILYRS